MQSLPLTDKRFVDFFRSQPETGMGYWIVTTVLKDGRRYPQTVVNGGVITEVNNYNEIPFALEDIATFEITHAKRDWSE